jgi:hypothetical protein
MHCRRWLKRGSNDLYFAREGQLERLAQHFAKIILGESSEAFRAMIIANALAAASLFPYSGRHTASQHLRAPETAHGTYKEKDR